MPVIWVVISGAFFSFLLKDFLSLCLAVILIDWCVTDSYTISVCSVYPHEQKLPLKLLLTRYNHQTSTTYYQARNHCLATVAVLHIRRIFHRPRIFPPDFLNYAFVLFFTHPLDLECYS
jgi:hypothetical protein